MLEPPSTKTGADHAARRSLPLPGGAAQGSVHTVGFASRTSVTAGDLIGFKVFSQDLSQYVVTISRFDGGLAARPIVTSPVLTAGVQAPPAMDPGTGLIACDWHTGWTLRIPTDWMSGLYVAEFASAHDEGAPGYTPFVVRRDAAMTDLCVVVPFVSFQADNLWPAAESAGTAERGGKSLSTGYGEEGRLDVGDRAFKVSFDRPYAGNGLPPAMEAIGFVIEYAQQCGYNLTYISDIDLHVGGYDISGFAGVIFPGPAEYWSVEMRSAVEGAVRAGTSFAFLSAGTMRWHTRLEPSAGGEPARTVVCYKHGADPETRPGMATVTWRLREPGPGNAEQNLLGVQYSAGVAEDRPLVVTNADHWFWRGTGLWEGDEIPDLVGGMADAYDARYGLPAGMAQTLLCASPFQADTYGRNGMTQNTSICEAPDGTLVFAAGTSRWACGLGDRRLRDERIRVATANVLARMVARRSVVAPAAPDEPPRLPPANAIILENRATGSPAWRVGRSGTRANDETHPRVAGYASATSVEAGSAIAFHVSVAATEVFTVSIYRMGHYGGAGARFMLEHQVVSAASSSAPLPDPVTGRVDCDWAVAWQLDVPESWCSGLYVAAFTTTSGYRALTPFVVRCGNTAAPICVVLPFLTYQANNRWPLEAASGKSLAQGFDGSGGTVYSARAFEVSFDRPYVQTGLPAKAYTDIEAIGWLESNGYDVVYASDVDIHDGGVDPDRFAGLLFLGQSSYWTGPLRQAVAHAVDHGTSLVLLGAGTCLWHARLRHGADGRANRVVVCYKSDPDPDAVDGAPATTRWRTGRPGPAEPEQRLLGVQLLGTATGADLVVANPEHWFWTGTGVVAGTKIEGMVKGQVDWVDPAIACPGAGTLLAVSPYTSAKGTPAIQHTNIQERENGAIVFGSGTESWMLGLGRANQMDIRVQTATRNLLDRVVAGHAATARRSRDVVADRPSPTTIENACAGTTAWRIGAGGTVANDDVGQQIAGYASTTSVDLGGTIGFHVTVNPAGPFTVALYRMGHYRGAGARLLHTSPRREGVPAPLPGVDPVTRTVSCDWPVSWTIDIPADWTSGLYYAVFTSERGFRSYTPFVVRDARRRDNLCVVLPVTTYQACNLWPLDGKTGRDLNVGYVAGAPTLHDLQRADAVSFDRPYARDGQPPRIEQDLAFIRWMEAENFDITYLSSIDLHEGWTDPGRYAALIFCGHDEYWSAGMRESVTAALEHGTSLAFLQAKNVYWHSRVDAAPDGCAHRRVVCVKDGVDRGTGADRSSTTGRWRDPRPAPHAAEQSLAGIQYVGTVDRPAPLFVTAPEHWVWSGTGVRLGEPIEDIVAGDVDGHDARYPHPDNVVTLASSPLPAVTGRRLTQRTTVYETGRGAIVFASGSDGWTRALGFGGRADPRIRRATANIFDRMQARGPSEFPAADAGPRGPRPRTALDVERSPSGTRWRPGWRRSRGGRSTEDVGGSSTPGGTNPVGG